MQPKRIKNDFSVRDILLELLEVVALVIAIGLFYVVVLP